jgi:hypothetical protein
MRHMAQRHHIETSLRAAAAGWVQGLWAERSAGRGPAEVRHIVSGVTASLAFIDAAMAAGADTCWCTTACSGAGRTAA